MVGHVLEWDFGAVHLVRNHQLPIYASSLPRHVILLPYSVLTAHCSPLTADTTDHDFILAEPHLLASGKRDSAIILAEMMYAWSQKGALDPAPYAVRGVLP